MLGKEGTAGFLGLREKFGGEIPSLRLNQIQIGLKS